LDYLLDVCGAFYSGRESKNLIPADSNEAIIDLSATPVAPWNIPGAAARIYFATGKQSTTKS